MRFPSMSMVLSTTLLLGSAPAAMAAQDAAVKVDVSTPATHTVWYADPVWLGVGAVVVVLIIVLAVMASRKPDGKTTTTVIR
jgi:hypothetical protein